ncbi:hypothetical protein N825_21300 [Skermanella stibiiresistens SB22]|uniref:Uncharacterized protein n=1 Tax=Skermanella stibiiresistens SB22 TaxID=1385369 RepID=W9GXH1_9PROT|nr:hypothetical protein [Skermanella stibiiresistens]EWY37127.1 hypothetical protein N825_21300 [Skermanella stibiiresistens SB22]
MQAIAEVSQAALPLRLGTVHVNSDGLLGIAAAPSPSNQRFVLDDLMFHISTTPLGAEFGFGTRFRIWAEIGWVPYTAQSPRARRDVLAILRASRHLERSCFVIDEGQKILVIGESRVDEHIDVTGLVQETLMFLQEVRPYLRILADHL